MCRSPKTYFKKNQASLVYLAYSVITLLTLSLFVQCDKSNQILVSYEKDGQSKAITRQELRWLISLQNKNPGKKPSIEFQQQLLKNYSFSLFLSQEVNPKNLEENEKYKVSSQFLNEKIKLAAYELYLHQQDKNINFDFVEIQLIFLRNQSQKEEKKNTSAKPSSRLQEAQMLANDLNTIVLGKKENGNIEATRKNIEATSEDIEEKIYQVSEHPIYRLQGGYIDPICTSCAKNPLQDLNEIIKKAKLGKFFVTPQNNTILIVRVIKKYSIDQDDLLTTFETFFRKTSRTGRRYVAKSPQGSINQQQLRQIVLQQSQIEELAKRKTDWLINQESRNRLLSKVNQIKKEKGYILKKAGQMNQGKPALAQIDYKSDTVLYSLNNKDYTYGSLEKQIKVARKQQKQPSTELQTIEKLRIMHGIFLPIAILQDQKDFQASQKHKVFDFMSSYIKNRTIAVVYYDQQKKHLNIKKDEVLRYYKQNQKSRYASLKQKNALKVVRQDIERIKLRDLLKQRQIELAKKYKLVIKNELLKIDEI